MISVIFVNWNSGEQLSDSIESIFNYNESLVLEIIVVDNKSSDNSMELLKKLELKSIPLKTTYNSRNTGFGFACNQGASMAMGEFLLFLNVDTLLSPSSLQIPYQFLMDKKNADVGIVGVQLVDENNLVAHSCAKFPTLGMFFVNMLGLNRISFFKDFDYHMLNWDHTTSKEVDHVIGAFFFVRRTLFESIHGFDERFFVYLEDLDFSLRARKSGWKTMFLGNISVFHRGGGTSSQVKAHRMFYALRSKLLYGFKHFSRLEAWILLVSVLTIEFFMRLLLAVSHLSWINFVSTLYGYRMLYADVINILNISFREQEI
jgi:GT2 family glycosyltransferase